MNWGLKIILSFVIFATGITVIVVMSMSANVDLVHEKYYEQEINYQKQIDILERSKSLKSDLSVNDEEGYILLTINNYQQYSGLYGKINFYRTADAERDYFVDLKFDESGKQLIPKNDMINGAWKIKFELNGNGENYFVEKNIYLN